MFLLLMLPMLLLIVAAGCAAPHPEWAADWNARFDATVDTMSHPCGDFAFDPWADEFLGLCGEEQNQRKPNCKDRVDWVWKRSRQCDTWQSWLLRNHNQQRRTEVPAPETRVGSRDG